MMPDSGPRPMNSRILGRMSLDPDRMAPDLRRIASACWSSAYSEYALGDWSTLVLWNRTGRDGDALSQEYDGCARETDIGGSLEYLNARIAQTFDRSLIKSVRVFRARNGGIIIPHVDYLEFRDGFHRVHVPLQSPEGSFNSEDATVYRMRPSEIWFVDGRRPHSGGCLSDGERLHLVIDFDPRVSLDSLIVDPPSRNGHVEPQILPRPSMTRSEERGILGLGHVIDDRNFHDIVSILAKVHYRRHASAQAMYAWLGQIAATSRDPAIVERVHAYQHVFIGALDVSREQLGRESSVRMPHSA
jgi:hypothetical protein